LDEKDFVKKGRKPKVPFVKWKDEKQCAGVILWTKMAKQFVYGTREPKVDEDGNALMQMLLCVEAEQGKRIMPVREDSDLHRKLSEAIDKAGAEEPEAGGYVDASVSEWVSSGAVTYPLFTVDYELPPSANGGDDSDKPPF
jgi:hypothetical protein